MNHNDEHIIPKSYMFIMFTNVFVEINTDRRLSSSPSISIELLQRVCFLEYISQ